MTGKDLKDLFDTSGMSGDEFASKMAISRMHLYRLFKADELKPMDVENSNVIRREVLIKHQYYLPLIDFNLITFFGKAQFEEKIKGCEFYKVPDFEKIGTDYCVRMPDNSMEPRIMKDDILGCKHIKGESFIQPGKVYVIDTSQGWMCRRLFEGKKKGVFKVIGDREESLGFEMPRSEFEIKALVVGRISVYSI
ncbi:MAG: S24/S26 family peptidase [Bacteroidetes bacterium]|nr:S24/S26 family peptidase [Bacteroidota bacterium]